MVIPRGSAYSRNPAELDIELQPVNQVETNSYEVVAAMVVARDKIRRSQEMTKIAMRLNPGAAEFHPGQQSGRQRSSGTQGQ